MRTAALIASVALAVAACSTPPTFVELAPDGGGAGGGGGTGTASAGGGGAGGAPARCSVPSDCAGLENECAFRTCEDGACGQGFRPNGFLIAVQAAGDCERDVCDGEGALIAQPFASDVPRDGDPCTDDVCTGSVPTNPVLAGASCGGPGVTCDAMGQCTGCTTDADCATPTECTSYTCLAGVCQIAHVRAGQGDLGGQTPGDCALKVCNGQDGISSIADDTDKPLDENVCTEDECAGGVASNPPKADGTPCGGSLPGPVCAAGQCSD